MPGLLSDVLPALALVGSLYTVFAAWQLSRSSRSSQTVRELADRPSVTILKPLHGDEPGLRENLEGFCLQAYPGVVQILFGVHDIGDPAVRVVRDLQRAHPQADISLVVDSRLHGENRKVSNLINMQRAIQGEVVVMSDSDISVECDYLDEVVAPLADRRVGFVTCLYTGRSVGTVWARLAALGVNYQFLPNVLAGVRLGMAHPCFGAMIALRHDVLEEIGGFAILADQLADDYDLGRAVRAAGYRGVLATRPVVHVCDERSWDELWSHEARWNRTIHAIDPVGYMGAVITFPLAWSLLGVFTAPGLFSLLALASALCARIYLVRQVDRATGLRPGAFPLLILRDLISFAVFLSAFFGRTVIWRGRRYRIGRDGALHPSEEILNAANPVPSSAILRRLRWRRGLPLSGQARDQVVLVSDLARPASRPGRTQPIDRRPAA